MLIKSPMAKVGNQLIESKQDIEDPNEIRVGADLDLKRTSLVGKKKKKGN